LHLLSVPNVQIRFCDRFVDPAFGYVIVTEPVCKIYSMATHSFVAGVNFFIYLAFLVPSEITALGLILQFWTDKIPIAVVITVVLLLYLALNIFAVRFYGGGIMTYLTSSLG
jgi:yeast amino acid transporter